MLREDDEHLYEIAARELEGNAPRKGLFAQAFAEAMGDMAKTKALYLRLRVAQLRVQQEHEQWENRPGAHEAERQHPGAAECQGRRTALDSPAACVKALREMGCAVGADATRSWTIVAPDGTPTRVFNFDGLQKHTLALRARAAGRRNLAAEPEETETAEASSATRPPVDTR